MNKKAPRTRASDAKLISELGTQPDGTLAKKYGVSRQRIQQIRKKMSITSHLDNLHTTLEKNKALIGTMSDEELAKKLKIGKSNIIRYRSAHDIKSYPKQEHERIKEQILPFLGKEPDSRVARRFDLTIQIVNFIRNKLKIPPYKVKHHKIDRDAIAVLLNEGKADEEVALTCNCNITFVSNIRRGLNIPKIRTEKPTDENVISDIERRLKEGESSSHIASTLRIPYGFVMSMKKKMSISKHHIPDDVIYELHLEGLTPRKIAMKLDLHPLTVRRKLRRIKEEREKTN